MKWLLIVFLGVIIVPIYAQNVTNPTDYQKLSGSINETHSELQNDYQKLSGSINDTHVELHNEHHGSDVLSFGFTIIAFSGSVIIAVIIARKQNKQSEKIEKITSDVSKLTEKIVFMIDKQNTLLQDRQSVYAESIMRWIDTEILDIDNYMKTWYPKYRNASGIEKDDIMHNIISTYKLHLQTRMLPIKSIDLVEIFGKEISNDWLKLWIKCMGDVVNVDYPSGMEYLKEKFDKIVEQAKGLKEKLNQF